MTRSPFFAVLLVCALPAFALEPKADYARMQKWQFSEAVPLAGPVTIARDTATWTLDAGTVRLMEPLSDGTVTGFVFEGLGRMKMTIPDRFELAQLRRFAAKKELAQIDEPFTQLIVRTSDPSIIKSLPRPGGAYAAVSLAEKRHEFWLEHLRRDTDALILAALLNPGMSAIFIDARTNEFDWLIYEYDSWRAEEITLSKFRGGFAETWVSLDRAEDRQPDGRPGKFDDPLTLAHVDVRADLTKRGRMGEVGDHGQRSLDGDYVVEAAYIAGTSPLGALRLGLHPIARELKAETADGTELTVIRDHVGKRFADIDNRVYDDDVLVVLPSPLKPGEKTTLRFRYEWESANYAPGGSWYPMVADTMLRPHTARLELTVHRKNEARAMGRLEKRTDNDKTETTVWVIDKPTKMVTFSTATRFEEVKLDPGGIPPIIAFGPDFQIDNRDKVRNVGADVANSMQFFQNLFDDKIEAPQFYVTSIASGHGQAFDGFLHMGEFTFEAEHPGASELFRAHEVAHEWFGHKVGWATYRDQWLSEAFAEYAAMMFVQGFVKNGDKFFDEILRSYHGVVKGQPFAGGFSKFNRPSLAKLNLNPVERERVGPIGHGFRANTSEIPGYAIQSYYKGPLVLHMLRSILRFRTRNDELFVKILREYVDLASGKYASTDDFRRIVEKHAGPGWGAFFDSWVYGAEIPSYAWSYDLAPEGEGFNLTVKVKRSGVSPDFMTIIPVEVNFDGDRKGYLFIVNRKDEESVTQKLPRKPKSVVFAPEYSVLGQIRRE